jgi:hypothetical protein
MACFRANFTFLLYGGYRLNFFWCPKSPVCDMFFMQHATCVRTVLSSSCCHIIHVSLTPWPSILSQHVPSTRRKLLVQQHGVTHRYENPKSDTKCSSLRVKSELQNRRQCKAFMATCAPVIDFRSPGNWIRTVKRNKIVNILLQYIWPETSDSVFGKSLLKEVPREIKQCLAYWDNKNIRRNVIF